MFGFDLYDCGFWKLTPYTNILDIKSEMQV